MTPDTSPTALARIADALEKIAEHLTKAPEPSGHRSAEFKAVQSIVSGMATFSSGDVKRFAPDIDAKKIYNILGYMARAGLIERLGRGEYKRTENVLNG